MSWGRLSRLLKPALLCGALAAPGLAGTMVGAPGTRAAAATAVGAAIAGGGGAWGRATASRVELGGRGVCWLD